ncbi:MAG TPA: 4-aminobutyrate--2-oxoglutarate transaminase [Actinomycetota bacterium]|nr:4-aminobutyrate--2-oxoglutarate transaminase [Actinomycetota bacterium]
MSSINMRTPIPGPRSKEIIERKERVVADPLDLHVPAVIERGEGARVTDVDGNVMLDFAGGLGCHLAGYSHPKVIEAVRRQAERFSHTDFSLIPYETYVELSERLVRLVGGERKTAFFNSGAEAVENAVKFARAATGRPAIVCFEGGFHGRTLLTMTLTSRHKPYKTGFGPFAPEVYRLQYPYPYRSAHPDEAGRLALDAIERAFVTVVDPRSVAAAVVEPVQGEGGFVVPTADFLPGLAEICRRHGILLIVDEIQSGFGRTGKFLASEHFGVEPDLVLLGKALASGYPLSAVVGRTEIMDAPGPSAIGGTYVGNPVACAAAIAVLDVIEAEGLIERAEQVGKAIRARWEHVAQDVPEIGEIRGIGAMIGVEFVTDRETKEPNEGFLGALIKEAMGRGVIAVSCGIYHNVLRHLIPLVISDQELEEGLDVLADAALSASKGRTRTPASSPDAGGAAATTNVEGE